MEPKDDITRLLRQAANGDREAEDCLLNTVYAELRRLAAHCMKSERGDHTLQPTALVHEAYLRLIRIHDIEWKDRGHFFAVAAQTIRRILVDHARTVRAAKRSGTLKRVSLDVVLVYDTSRAEEILAVDEALNRLAEMDARQCRIIELRFFAGLSLEETADALGISTRTVKRDWNVARAWLYGQFTAGQ